MNNENNVNNQENTISNTQSNIANNTNIQSSQDINNKVEDNNIIEEKKYEDMALPELPKEQIVIETVKKKEKSSLPFILILISIVFVTVYYVEDIIDFFENTINNKNPSSVIDIDDNNLVDGYIQINDNTGNIKVNELKFYNFNKNDENLTIAFNYLSNKKIINMNDENIYIEFYNSNKEVLYKGLFNVEGTLYSNEVKSYNIKLNSDIYEQSAYALVRTYNESELNKETKLTCELKENNDEYNLTYKNTYIFKNDLLVSYEVYKSLEIIDEAKTNKYKKDIENEYNYVKSNNIENIYESNSLSYTIDLQNELNEFIPIYEKNTTYFSVKNKDLLKKWECE